MDEKDLNALIRMAGEVDAMESDRGSKFAWSRRSRSPFLNSWAGVGGLAAAACLAMGVMVWMKSPSPTVAPMPIAINTPEKPVAPEAAPAKVASTDGSIVMAVFHDADDRCTCVQLKDQKWGKGRTLADVGSGELLRSAMADPCHDNPQRVVVIAMAGPKEFLPKTTAEAEILATCVSESSRCGDDSLCYASNAMGYLPPGVSVMAETMGMGRR